MQTNKVSTSTAQYAPLTAAQSTSTPPATAAEAASKAGVQDIYSGAMVDANRGIERTTAALKAAGTKPQAALAGARVGMASGVYAGSAVGTAVGLALGEVASKVSHNSALAARAAALGCTVGSALGAATVGVAGALLGTVGGVVDFVAQGTPKADPQTVSGLDIKRYMGTWYEIAHYDNWFEKPGQAATAEYSLRPDGTVRVVNTAYDDKGSPKSIEGNACLSKAGDPAKLRVSFTPFLEKYFVGAANYWVIDLQKDYQYAVVGDPTRSSLWVLSRTPKLDDATFQEICDHVKAQGFEPSRLIRSAEVPADVAGHPSQP